MPKVSGYRKDGGAKGFIHTDKPLVFQGASWYEPRGSAIFFDDFMGGIATETWDAVGVQATTGVRFAYVAAAGGADGGHGGWIKGTTGTGDDDMEGLFGQSLNWTSLLSRTDGMLTFEARLCLPVITTVACVAGFTDAITETSAGNLFNLSGTTAGTQVPTDAAVWFYDTDATTDVFYGQGTANDVDTAYAAYAVGVAPPTDDPFTVRIEIDSAQVGYFSMSGTGTDRGDLTPRGAVAGCGRSTIAMTPLIGITARDGTDSLSIEADYVFCAAPRSVA